MVLRKGVFVMQETVSVDHTNNAATVTVREDGCPIRETLWFTLCVTPLPPTLGERI